MNVFVRRDEFSETEYASLGCLLVALTNLDDVIGRCAMKLNLPADDTPCSEAAKAGDRIVGASSVKRFQQLLQLLPKQDKKPLDPNDCSEILNLMKWRNAICHGRYSRGSCGNVRIEFFSIASVKKGGDPEEGCLNQEEARQLANEANRLSHNLHDRFLNK